ncbi:hypothetical protein CHRYSEOSP005_29890 [Chryseobacterium sp. Alg-005]|uniref:hypothetical protein n=1 Tax=Chryseobacterium sp. Alg-005 TaxID=3159516 RepID=UPI003555A3CA
MLRKVLLILLYLYALTFSVLKTIRFPNDWSESHWMLDYRFGFIKRGLAGEIFGWLFEKNELTILILSAGTLFLLYASLFTIAVKETLKNEISFYRILFFLIFFLSQYVVFSAHLIGYLDHIVFLLTILVICLIKQKKIILSSVIVTVCILVHEVSFFLMLPISCFALIVTQISDGFSFKTIFSISILKKLAVVIVLPLFTVISVSLYQEANGENYFPLIFNYLRQIPFISEKAADSVASAYTKSFSYYFKEESGSFIQRLFISKATIFYGIPILFCVWMIFKELKFRQNLQLFLLLLLISCIPLLLHGIAYDTYRIWSFPFMIQFLGFWILSSELKSVSIETGKLSALEICFFIISFILVSFVPNVLMDDETERFSLTERLILVIPILFIIYLLRKFQPGNES